MIERLRNMRVAFVGNQNSGKSTLFNTLTGLNQKIGNWPGVTVEKKEGWIKREGISVVDLPGIYSLHPYTKEEEITREQLLQGNVDVIVNVIDCHSLARGLYVTLQLLELQTPMVVALNFVEIAEKKGIVIDATALAEMLQVPVVKISALTGKGLPEMIGIIKQIGKKKRESMPVIAKRTEEEIQKRYQKIDTIVSQVMKKKPSSPTITDRIDAIVLHRLWAIPIFFLLLGSVYYLAIEVVGNGTNVWICQTIEQGMRLLETWCAQHEVWPWLCSLWKDGIANGMEMILRFFATASRVICGNCYLGKGGVSISHFFAIRYLVSQNRDEWKQCYFFFVRNRM